MKKTLGDIKIFIPKVSEDDYGIVWKNVSDVLRHEIPIIELEELDMDIDLIYTDHYLSYEDALKVIELYKTLEIKEHIIE